MSAHAQATDSRQTLKLVIGAIGVVYGDIGTSPLYAFKESFLGARFAADFSHILGVLSLIFWSVTITVTLKYIMLMMRADNKGEGGSLSLFALASRFSHDTKWIAAAVPILGIFAAALFYGDSMITPAISIMSSVEGLQIAAPHLSPYVLPFTILILAFLFSFQKLGTGNVGTLFGPIMCVWFLTLTVLGIIHIWDNPFVLKAINPYYAIHFFMEDKLYAFLTLGSVVLAMTGAEALYADMGHFGKGPIRIAWVSLVFPALMINYFGQGAFILSTPEGLENPFFLMAPGWMSWPLLILATLATIIASQAVISGAFSVTQQAIQLGYLPRMTIIHTSDDQIGQIYIPFINWMLMFFVFLLVITFQSSSKLAHAYGVAVTGTMLIDTLLLGVVIFKVWHWKKPVAIVTLSALLLVDTSFFLATATKIVHGGWFPLLLGTFIFILLTTWKRGRQLVLQKLRAESMPVDVFFRDYCENFTRVAGTAIYMYNLNDGIPVPLLQNLKHNKVLHETNYFLHVVIEEKSYVPAEERIKITTLGQDIHRITIRYGFMDEVNVPRELEKEHVHGVKIDPHNVTYFIGRETVIPTSIPGMAIWREHLFSWMTKNASSASDYYNLPSKRVMEIGSRIDI
ncbi:MAG: potassium transporter Kup [Pseudobdellovibrionaceae bacterium]|jgi:KUP system potassium uptake protein|nr:potassium transporter Kup [Pseudobdellovibrionaceae bacterium]